MVFEDIVTSDGSLLETVRTLQWLNVRIENAVVVLNREQGGASIHKKKEGIKMSSLKITFYLTKLFCYIMPAN